VRVDDTVVRRGDAEVPAAARVVLGPPPRRFPESQRLGKDRKSVV